jgi:tetratricopeptide (TPR) repeat protein
MDTQQKIGRLLQQAWDKRRTEKYGESLDLLRRAETLCTQDDHHLLGRIYHIHRQLKTDQGLHIQALPHALKSIEHYRASGEVQHIAHSVRHLADLEFKLGQLDGAEEHYREAIQIYINDDNTTKLNLANTLRGYAMLTESQENIVLALGLWEEVKTLYNSIDIPEGVEEANQHLEALDKDNNEVDS